MPTTRAVMINKDLLGVGPRVITKAMQNDSLIKTKSDSESSEYPLLTRVGSEPVGRHHLKQGPTPKSSSCKYAVARFLGSDPRPQVSMAERRPM